MSVNNNVYNLYPEINLSSAVVMPYKIDGYNRGMWEQVPVYQNGISETSEGPPLSPSAPSYQYVPSAPSSQSYEGHDYGNIPAYMPPSYDLSAVGERTSRLVEMSSEVANNILESKVEVQFESDRVPAYQRPQINENRSWFSYAPIKLDFSRREYNILSSKTVIIQPQAPKSREEIEEEKRRNENTQRAVLGTIGVGLLLGMLYQLGQALGEVRNLICNYEEYKTHISTWNADRVHYFENDNILINNIAHRVCRIYEKQKTDGMFKLVCYTLGAMSGASLLGGALYRAKELYSLALGLSIIASSVGILRYGYRRNDPQDLADAKFISEQINTYNKYKG